MSENSVIDRVGYWFNKMIEDENDNIINRNTQVSNTLNSKYEETSSHIQSTSSTKKEEIEAQQSADVAAVVALATANEQQIQDEIIDEGANGTIAIAQAIVDEGGDAVTAIETVLDQYDTQWNERIDAEGDYDDFVEGYDASYTFNPTDV